MDTLQQEGGASETDRSPAGHEGEVIDLNAPVQSDAGHEGHVVDLSAPKPEDTRPGLRISDLNANVPMFAGDEADIGYNGQDVAQTINSQKRGQIGTVALPFTIPQRLVTGNIARFDSGFNDILAKRQQLEAEDKNSWGLLNKANELIDTIAPRVYPSDIINEHFPNMNRYGKFAAGLAADLVTDPLFSTNLGGLTKKGVAEGAARAGEFRQGFADALTKGDQEAFNYLLKENSTKIPVKDFSQEVESGNKALVNFHWPLMPNKVVGSLGTENETAVKIASMFDSSVPPAARAGFAQHVMDKSLGDSHADSLYQIVNPKNYTDGTKQAASAIAQYGEEKAKNFLKWSNAKVTDQEFEQGQKLYSTLDGIVKDARSRVESMGLNVNDYEAIKPADREKYLNEIRNMFPGNLPKGWEDYAFREQYGLPRRMTPQAVNAMDEGIVTDGMGMKIRPGAASQKESSKYSTFIMDMMEGKKTGMIQSFDQDPITSTIERVRDLNRAAADKRLVDTVGELGLTRDEAIAKYGANNVAQITGKPWEKFQSFQNQGKTYLSSQPQYFPKDVAQLVQMRFGVRPSVGVGIAGADQMLQGMNWFNNQWKKMQMLSTPFRFVPAAIDSMSAYVMGGGSVSEYWNAAKDFINYKINPSKADPLTRAFMSSPYAQNVASIEAKVGSKMKVPNDEAGLASNVPFWKSAHEAAKTGQPEAFDRMMNLDPDFLKNVKGKDGQTIAQKLFSGMSDAGNKFRQWVVGSPYDISKLAMARTHVLRDGMPVAMAMDLADKKMLSFTDNPQVLNNLQAALPYARYQYANIQRIPLLAASSPWGVDFYNKLKSNWMKANWTPEEAKALDVALGGGFRNDPIPAFYFEGTKDLVNDHNMINYLRTAIPSVAGDKDDSGFMVQVNLPSIFDAPGVTFNPDNMAKNMGPIAKMAMAAMNYDPNTGAQFKYEGSETANLMERAKAALDQVKGGIVPPVVSKLVNMAMAKGREEFINKVATGPQDQSERMATYQKLWGKSYKDIEKEDRKAFSDLFDMTLGGGLASLNSTGYGAMMRTMSMIGQYNRALKDATQECRSGATEARCEYLGGELDKMREKIGYNVDALDTVEKAVSKARPALGVYDKLERDAYEKSMAPDGADISKETGVQDEINSKAIKDGIDPTKVIDLNEGRQPQSVKPTDTFPERSLKEPEGPTQDMIVADQGGKVRFENIVPHKQGQVDPQDSPELRKMWQGEYDSLAKKWGPKAAVEMLNWKFQQSQQFPPESAGRSGQFPLGNIADSEASSSK